MKKALILVVVLLVLAGGAFALMNMSDDPKESTSDTTPSSQTSTTNTDTQTQNTEEPAQAAENTSATTITYTDNGFSPKTLTVKAGTTITVKNDSSRLLQFSSDPHPQHTDEDELNMSTISPGKSGTLTVNAKGAHGFHNHLNESHTGTLTIE